MFAPFLDIDSALTRMQLWRAQGDKIVFTNGCFDILHRGHVDYLAKAKALGDKLILGLNSDSSVRQLKGTSRPVNNQFDRAIVLGALRSIDCVVIFEEDTPIRLLEAFKPDIFVKGGDYDPETMPGASLVRSYGGDVRVLPFLEGYSTSLVINKLSS